MDSGESHVYKILKKYSTVGEWKYFELFDKNKETLPQIKNYNGYPVAYPDFEYYSDSKLTLLVEVKNYLGYFNGVDDCVAIKLRHYKSYREVQKEENIIIKLCFVITKNNQKFIFWETLDNILKMRYVIQDHVHTYKHNGKTINKTEKYIFWYTTNFRTDENNLPKVGE